MEKQRMSKQTRRDWWQNYTGMITTWSGSDDKKRTLKDEEVIFSSAQNPVDQVARKSLTHSSGAQFFMLKDQKHTKC